MKKKIIAGADEVGIGPLAGPVTACLVAANQTARLYQKFWRKGKDSKSLSPKKRKEVFEKIKSCKEIEWKTSSVWPKTIDKINILKASFLAYKRCFKKLKRKPDLIFVDGNKVIPTIPVLQVPIVKGDKKHPLIAFASIIAKVKRDETMKKISKRFPKYKFETHKGYPTKLHFSLLKKHKPCAIHRKSYTPVKKLLTSHY